MELEELERFENVPIPNYSTLYRSKTSRNYGKNVEKLYFHEIGEIGRIEEIRECSNSNINLQELYFDSRILRES